MSTLGHLARQINGGEKLYGGITDREQLKENLFENCLPGYLPEEPVTKYEDFLVERPRLMALKIKSWFKNCDENLQPGESG